MNIRILTTGTLWFNSHFLLCCSVFTKEDALFSLSIRVILKLETRKIISFYYRLMFLYNIKCFHTLSFRADTKKMKIVSLCLKWETKINSSNRYNCRQFRIYGLHSQYPQSQEAAHNVIIIFTVESF